MEHVVHLPACVLLSKGAVTLPAMRRVAIERIKDPTVGCYIPTDARLLRYAGPMGGMKRVAVIGGCLMEAINDLRPQFQRSVVNGQVLETEGITIYLTGRTRGGGETIVATWDYGEPVTKAFDRLNQLRKTLAGVPDEVAHAIMSTDFTPNLPPPAALLSDVIGDGEDDPQTSLFGCGGSAPVSLAVGVKTTHLCVDHRLHDPIHFVALARAYQGHLDGAFQVRLKEAS